MYRLDGLDVYKRQNLALVIKDAKQKNALVALNVINDNNSSEKKEQQGKRNLEKAAMIAAAADVPVTMVSRYDLNIEMCIRDSDDTFHLCHQFFGNRTFGTSFCSG